VVASWLLITEQRRRGFDQEFAPDQLPLDPDIDAADPAPPLSARRGS
jgi:hypothetical protein